LEPFLTKTNPQYNSDYYSYFILVVKGKFVKKFLDMLADAGYKSPYGGKSSTLVARVKPAYEGDFPVRNLQKLCLQICVKLILFVR
jgi:hypothetical protein